MSIFKTWYDWVQDLGQQTGDFSQQVSTGLVKVWCGVANKYPNLTAFNPFGRGLLESYCPLAGAPTPPDAEGFTGGQCDGVAYVCTGIYVNGNVNRGGCYETKTWTSNPIVGAVTGLYFSSADGASVNVENSVGQRQICNDDGTGTILRNSARQCGYTTVSAPQAYAGFIKIVECHPADDSPDVCGDLFPTFPPDPPIDPDDFQGNIVYNVFNVDGDPIYNDILNYQVNINPGDTNNIDIDLGGINFNFGADGINTKDVPVTPTPDPNIRIPFIPDDFTRFFPWNPAPEPEEEPLPVEEEEVEDPEIVWVLVDIIEYPTGGKAVFNSNAADSVFDAGWFHWTISTPSGTFRLPAQAIRSPKSAFKAPIDSVGYRMYARNGARLGSTLYKQKIESEE